MQKKKLLSLLIAGLLFAGHVPALADETDPVPGTPAADGTAEHSDGDMDDPLPPVGDEDPAADPDKPADADDLPSADTEDDPSSEDEETDSDEEETDSDEEETETPDGPVYGFTEDGYYSYFDGKPVTGSLWLDGNLYWIKEDGTRAENETIRHDGSSYYYGADGKLVKGLVSGKDGPAYYSWYDGHAISGIIYDNGQYIPVGNSSSLRPGLIQSEQGTFYREIDGSLAKNRLIETDGVLRYFGPDGKMMTGTVINADGTDYFLNSSGQATAISGEEAQVYQAARSVYAAVGTSLLTLFNWTVSHIGYSSDILTKSDAQYALQGINQGFGNCYTYAATFRYLAYFLGYNAQMVRGHVLYNSGAVGVHGWVMIDGLIYDPEAEYELGGRANFFGASPSYPPISYIFP